jgi:DNA-binding NarL/FixJ family response regulator
LPTTTTKVLLVDDRPLVFDSIRQLLAPPFTIVDSVQNSEYITARALEQRPDVVLMDACMPGIDGFEATRQLKKLLPNLKVILVTMPTEPFRLARPFGRALAAMF